MKNKERHIKANKARHKNIRSYFSWSYRKYGIDVSISYFANLFEEVYRSGLGANIFASFSLLNTCHHRNSRFLVLWAIATRLYVLNILKCGVLHRFFVFECIDHMVNMFQYLFR